MSKYTVAVSGFTERRFRGEQFDIEAKEECEAGEVSTETFWKMPMPLPGGIYALLNYVVMPRTNAKILFGAAKMERQRHAEV